MKVDTAACALENVQSHEHQDSFICCNGHTGQVSITTPLDLLCWHTYNE